MVNEWSPIINPYLTAYISIWDVEEGVRQCTNNNQNHSSKITASEFINPHDVSLLLTGTGGCGQWVIN